MSFVPYHSTSWIRLLEVFIFFQISPHQFSPSFQQFDASDIKSLPLCFRYIESLARRQIMTHHLLPESIYLMTVHIISPKREVRRNGLSIREGAYYDFLG